MNCVNLTGRLTKNPEVRYSNDQMAIAIFTLAVNREFAKKGAEQTADFISVKCFGKTAELVEKYVSKGKQIGVSGRIQTGSYKNKDGNTVYTTDVIADRVEFLESKPKAAETKAEDVDDQTSIPSGFEKIDEDIPF